MTDPQHLKSIQQLTTNNTKLLDSAQNYLQKCRTQSIQTCYQKNNGNPLKFAKCADDSYNKSQKAFQMFQFKLLYSKINFTQCLIVKKQGIDKCKKNANNIVLEAKAAYSKEIQ